MDRITQVRIRNVRAIEALDLDVSRMTVLIGENGAGKSTIIECLEILRQAAEPRFMERLYAIHQGAFGLLRRGANWMSLGLVVEDSTGAAPKLDYEFVIRDLGVGFTVQVERLLVGQKDDCDSLSPAFERVGALGTVFDGAGGMRSPLPERGLVPDRLVLSSFGANPPQPSIGRLIQALERIEVHLSFDTLASWAARSLQIPQSIRVSTTLFPAKHLRLLGTNLASAWAELRNQDQEQWEYSLGLARLGLGEALDSVAVLPDAGGGNVALSLRFSHFKQMVPAAGLSNGQLAWLAFVAIYRLHNAASMLVVDEPELHLHPGLLGRVVSMLQSLDGPGPVIVATHSDRVLGLLEDPADSVRVLSLDEGKVSQSRLDKAQLEAWLKEYDDFGAIRADGMLRQVLLDPEVATGGGTAVVPEGFA